MVAQPKILTYDIESSLMKAYIFGLGKQVVRHTQLDKDHCQPRIICISYCWNDGKPAKCIDWGYEEQNSARVVEEFDKIIKQADYTIGKNSKRFDEKMINAVRMLKGLPGLPQWIKYSEDLEQQMRRYFRLPSQSLDYISGQLGLGGKIKMDFDDWIHILEKTPKLGEKAFKKMCKYCCKDVEDTRKLWNMLSKHFDTRINIAAFNDDFNGCKKCGGNNLKKNGTSRTFAGLRYQEYWCSDCESYAGRSKISAILKKEGRII